MSFSQTVKGELIDAQYTEPCCRKAFLYGMCLFGKSFSSRQVALQTENPRIAEKYSVLLAEICRVEAAVPRATQFYRQRNGRQRLCQDTEDLCPPGCRQPAGELRQL